ncbi:MAG: hypothetical protein Kow0090_03160 [Myxococcota bacterium]
MLAGCAGIAAEQPKPSATKKIASQTVDEERNVSQKIIELIESPVELVPTAERLCQSLSSKERRELGYALAKEAFRKAKEHKGAALTLARCAFLLADVEDEEKLVLEYSRAGMEAGKVARGEEKDARASYYYALNIGLYIREKGIKAIGRVSDFHEALKDANKAPDEDFGGPMRVLGLLYLKAPPWPRSVGDIDAALELLEEAAKRFPSHPQNHIFYAEALFEEGRKDEAKKELELAERLALPELWGEYAQRWQKEIEKFKKKLEE